MLSEDGWSSPSGGSCRAGSRALRSGRAWFTRSLGSGGVQPPGHSSCGRQTCCQWPRGCSLTCHRRGPYPRFLRVALKTTVPLLAARWVTTNDVAPSSSDARECERRVLTRTGSGGAWSFVRASLARTWPASGCCRSSRMTSACCQASRAWASSQAAWRASPRRVRVSASSKRAPDSRSKLSARW
jgi:hypothetical protein